MFSISQRSKTQSWRGNPFRHLAIRRILRASVQVVSEARTYIGRDMQGPRRVFRVHARANVKSKGSCMQQEGLFNVS